MKSDEKKIQENQELVLKLVDSFPEPRRTKVREMLEGQVGISYFTAPASSREAFHSCFPGGLAEHSLNVVKQLVKLAGALAHGQYDMPKLVFCGLFHDLGKVGDGLEDYYVPTDQRWKKERGEHYDINPKCIYMPTSERGLYILQRHGIEVDHEEYLAIRLNDGQYVRENEPYRMKEPDLALLVHWADMWATKQEK